MTEHVNTAIGGQQRITIDNIQRMTPMDRSHVDKVHRAVSDHRRRTLLRYLRQRPGETVSLETAIDVVADPDTDPPDKHSVAIDLYHKHLPVLTDAGLITFDSERLTVRYDPQDDPLTVGDDSRLEQVPTSSE